MRANSRASDSVQRETEGTRIRTRRPFSLRALVTVVTALLCASPVSVVGEDLTRENAKALLNGSAAFPRAVTYEIPVGPEVNIEMYIKGNYAVDRNRGQTIDNSFGCLKRLGYISITPRPRSAFGTPVTISGVSVTGKGRELGEVMQKRLPGYNTAYVFRVAEREVVRVTGIKNTNDGSATVEFEWQQSNFNDVYKCMFKPDTALYGGSARLGKFDDGWRLEKVSLR
jgi:hypothetical protein